MAMRGDAERDVAVPAEFDDMVAWVTWLYYVDELTQSEIADRVRMSRATIIKLLQDARERGAVTIRVSSAAMARTRLSRALSRAYSLDAAYIIPSLAETPLTRRLGEAGAHILGAEMTPGDIIGVAWGRTVMAVAESMQPPERAGPYTVVQVCGSSPGSAPEFSPELCSSVLASRIGARCTNLLAPAVVSTTKLRGLLMAEPALLNQFELIRSATRVLFGVGDVTATATVRLANLASSAEIDDYVRRGARGVLLGRFIDGKGRPVTGDLDERMIGITLSELRDLPNRLCFAGGSGKVEALRAALQGGYVTHLVTDEHTAVALLK